MKTEKKTQNITFRLPPEELEALDEQAEKEFRDRSGMLRWMIKKYIENANRGSSL
jgi:metal-responsive CopG/Arc/MetJ family transcriptional regulator